MRSLLVLVTLLVLISWSEQVSFKSVKDCIDQLAFTCACNSDIAAFTACIENDPACNELRSAMPSTFTSTLSHYQKLAYEHCLIECNDQAFGNPTLQGIISNALGSCFNAGRILKN